MSAPIIDGDFSFPIEIEGSGARTFSQYNTFDYTLERLYAVNRLFYNPTIISVPDYQFPRAIMVEETVVKNDAAFTYIKRTFMTVPQQRIEGRNVAFTFPGSSRYSITSDGKASYDRYGNYKPATVYRQARVTYSYSQGQVTTGFPTQILFQGQPVDFTGEVWNADASTYLGATDPIVAPDEWVVSDTCRRVRGNIWERELIQVFKSG